MDAMIDQTKYSRPPEPATDAICQHAHVIVRDLQNRVLFWSDRDAAIYGWLAEEAVGRDCDELLGSQYPEELDAVRETASREGRWEGDVVHHRRDDQRDIHVHSIWMPCHGADGEVVGHIEINEDVTHQKKVKKELRERERDFRMFFELSAVGNVMTCPKTGKFVRVNEAFCRIAGRSQAQLLDKTAFDITHPDDRERDEAGWKDAMNTGCRHFTIEKRYVRGDGRSIWVSVTSTLVRDDSGEPVYALGVVTDIDSQKRSTEEVQAAQSALEHRVDERTRELATANRDLNLEIERRKKMATRLSQANQTLTTLIHAIPVVIAGLDSKGHVEIWNPEAEKRFSIPASATDGTRLPDLPISWLHPENISSLLADVPRNGVARYRSADGSLRDLNIWTAPTFDADGKPDGHVLVALDETEKRFLEGALLDAGTREQRRIGQELHDHLCQQLLGAAFGAQALARELERAESVSASRAQSLARLINESVIDARNMARGINPIEIDPAGLMSALHEMAARVPTGVRVDIECDRPVLVSDSEKAFHVFRIAQEAVTNALRHGGADHLRIHLSSDQDEVTLQVIDNGKRAATEEPRDLNLGVELMKYRARAIHGELSIDSTGDGHTTVTCRFPNQSKTSHAND